MDKLESLGQQLSQVTMYDIKSYYNQAKNIILNVSEMEGKVQEATNDEPWGASSTLMNEISQGTFHFQSFNEIMPAIYSRFMDKEAKQWRQIYKALQLLEYLIKNGSERTVDDARSHIATIKMLRNFHYIDEKGKDQGINVRNRAREIIELLSDLDRVRSERRKAKTNKNKYVGTGNDGMSFSSGGSRYGGFGSDSLYGGSGAGGDREYGGSSSSYGAGRGFRDQSSSNAFPEYDAGDDEDLPPRSSAPTSPRTDRQLSRQGTASTASAKKPANPPPPAKKAPEVDLLGGFDEEPISAPSTEKALPPTAGANALDSFDDFGDFEAAPQSPPLPVPTVQPQSPIRPAQTNVTSQGGKATLFDLLGQNGGAAASQMAHARQLSNPMVPTPTSPGFNIGSGMGIGTSMGNNTLAGRMAGTPNVGMANAPQRTSSFPISGGVPSFASPPLQAQPAQQAKPATVKPASGTGGFEDLWSMSLGASTAQKQTPGGGKSMQELEREKAQRGLWGAPASSPFAASNSKPQAQSGSGGFGNFGGDDNLLL